MKKLTILVDFDGTVTTHEFPAIGKDIGAAPVLRELVAAGHQLILWTMRSNKYVGDSDGDLRTAEPYLEDAIQWFKDRNIPLYGINTNPTQHTWSSSPKAYGTLCIDDINLGARLIKIAHLKPFIDWKKTYEDLCEMKLIPWNDSTLYAVEAERLAMLKSYM